MSCEVNYWLSLVQVSHPVKKTKFRHQLHRLIWKAYPGFPASSKQPFLFTVSTKIDSNGVYCLVQSASKPAWSNVSTSKDEDVLLNKVHGMKNVCLTLSKGDQFSFRLTAAPIKNLHQGLEKRGNKVRMKNQKDIQQWFERKSLENGFSVMGYEFNFSEVKVRKHSEKEEAYIPLTACQFDGRLQLIDPKRFEAALVEGVGQKKIFGFGMLTIGR